MHNLPDSPMLDTSSSFGSTSSSPSLANLPPIRVHVEESGGARGMQDQRLGIEEQFARFNVGNNKQLQHQQEDGFAAISSPPPMPVTIALPAAPVSAATASSEFQTRVILDDERSDHGVAAGYRKPPTPRSQPQNLAPQQAHQVKSNSGGGHELPSPNSVSSDSSMNNPMFHPKTSAYQEPISQMPSGSTVVAGLINPSDPNTLLSQNQNQEPGYIINPQFEQQQSTQSQPQLQQFIHAAPPQYIHHHPSSGRPVPTYIQVYPSQQQQSFHRHPGQLDQQPYPVYYVAAPPPPMPYSVSEAPGSLPSSHPQAPPSSTMMPPPPNNHMRSVPGGKPETGVYTTATGMGGAQMVHQIPTSQQQFMGFSQIHHPPQSASAGIPNYGYEYADNAHKQVYYTQPLGHAQYQTMTGPPPAMVLPDGSAPAKLPAENMTQQIRSSQPL